MPEKGAYINMWNEEGKKFSGKVIQCRKNLFFIIENGTNARAWIDLNRLNYWAYQNEKEKKTSEKTHVTRENADQSNPSVIMLICIPFDDEY